MGRYCEGQMYRYLTAQRTSGRCAVHSWFLFCPRSSSVAASLYRMMRLVRKTLCCRAVFCFDVSELAGRGQVSIGAELSVAVGPVGRTGAGNVSVAAEGVAHAYSCE